MTNRAGLTRIEEDGMPLVLISLFLVLITFFIVLIRFVETDPEKVEHFKRDYSRSLSLKPALGAAKRTVEKKAAVYDDFDPLQTLINRMKVEGISVPLMNQYLTTNQIKTLQLISGETGLVLRLPQAINMHEGSAAISDDGRKNLDKLSALLLELPYTIEIHGVGVARERPADFQTLEKGVMASQSVYRYLLQMGIVPEKLKISGTTADMTTDLESYVDLTFRENT